MTNSTENVDSLRKFLGQIIKKRELGEKVLMKILTIATLGLAIATGCLGFGIVYGFRKYADRRNMEAKAK